MWKYEIWLNMKNQPYLFLPQPLHAPHSSLFSKKKDFMASRALHGLFPLLSLPLLHFCWKNSDAILRTPSLKASNCQCDT